MDCSQFGRAGFHDERRSAGKLNAGASAEDLISLGMRILRGLSLGLTLCLFHAVAAISLRESYLARFELRPAPPKPSSPLLHEGDRLAICGDSITEQRKYSRILETYLTVCEPRLKVEVRQFGWSGETAAGFLGRMTNDTLRFHPTIATTCYGMNDHRYVPYTEEIGRRYRESMGDVVKAFEDHGVRVVLGSAGCVGKMPSWVHSATGTVLDLNLNLARLRYIDLDLAAALRAAGFGDVFKPMIEGDFDARLKYGTNYCLPGRDGVHPGWAGHLVMAYAFLHGLGLKGDLGAITVELRRQHAEGRAGHDVLGMEGEAVKVRSVRYPFCAPQAAPQDDNSIRSGFQWVPFQSELNRLTLVVKDASRNSDYSVVWGGSTKHFKGRELRRGVNLAQAFETTPFDAAFAGVDAAVAAKQEFETRQIQREFHGDAGKVDMEGTVRRTEEERERLVAAVRSAFTPVEHTILIRLEK